MSTLERWRPGRLGVAPAPAVSVRHSSASGAMWLAALVLAVGVAVALPHPNYALLFGATVGAVALVALIGGKQLGVKVGAVTFYLLTLNGPVKLLASSGREATSGIRDVLIVAVCLSPLLGMVVRRERVVLPPLAGWVVAWTALVLVEAFNPHTAGFLHALAGYRQLLEWVPFFFFGYALMRSRASFRKAFLVLGVAALASGVVSTYQTFLSPAQLATWGPGYYAKIYPASGKGSRQFSSEGESHVRPPGLGADSGAGGGLGVVALPGALALLACWRARRRWLIVLLNLGAMLAIVTSLGRLQLIGAAISVLAFMGLASVAGRRVRAPIAALLGVLVIAVPLGGLLISTVHNGTFSRYEKIGESSTSYKSSTWEHVPHLIQLAPFGFGLGSVGPVSSLGGTVTEVVEGRRPNSETQWNFLVDELGAPGLILWVGLAISVLSLAVRRLRTIPDDDLRVCLAATVAPLVAMCLMGFSGPLLTSGSLGPDYWFIAGVAAYWFAGPARVAAVRARMAGAPPAKASLATAAGL